MIITSVERNKKNKERFSVFIDGEYCFSVSEEAYLRMGLYEKKEITGSEIEHLKIFENFKTAKSSAIRYLSLKLHSEREVQNKLENEGFDHKTIDSVIEELKSIGYINDKIYVQKFIYDRSKLKPKAKKMLKFELLSKGISESIIDEILNEWEVDEETVANNLIKKKFGKYNFEDENVIKKIYSFLRHRGYSFEIIDSITKNIRRSSE